RSAPRVRRGPAVICPAASVDQVEQPPEADRGRPLPDLPQPGVAVGRKEDDLGPTDQVVDRYVADVGHAAVQGIVTIVAHREHVTFRAFVDVGVVEGAVRHDVEHGVAAAAGQGLTIAGHVAVAGAVVVAKVVHAYAGSRLPVDGQKTGCTLRR